MESFGVSGGYVGSSKEVILLLPGTVDKPKPRGDPEFLSSPSTNTELLPPQQMSRETKWTAWISTYTCQY